MMGRILQERSAEKLKTHVMRSRSVTEPMTRVPMTDGSLGERYAEVWRGHVMRSRHATEGVHIARVIGIFPDLFVELPWVSVTLRSPARDWARIVR